MKRFRGRCVLLVGVVFFFVVKAKADPIRIVSTAPNLTEAVFAVGAGDLLVGRSTACDTPAAVLEIPAVGPFALPDPQKTLALHPTLLLATHLVNPAVRPLFVDGGVQVLELPTESVEEIPRVLERIGAACGRIQQARSVADALRKKLRSLTLSDSLSQRRRVIVLLDAERTYTAGGNGFLHQALTFFPVENAAASDARPYHQISMEEIVRQDPDLLLCLFPVTEDDPASFFRKRVGWRDLRAVRSGRVYTLPHPELFMRPGPRIAEGLAEWRTVLDADARAHGKPSQPVDTILRKLFWTRTVTAWLVGGALALAGCVFQTVLRNPLADPFILGVSGGASLGAALWITLGLSVVCPLGIPLMAFATAFLTLGFVYRVARAAGRPLKPETLLLSGVMFSAIESSLLLLLLSMASPLDLQRMMWWTLGNLQVTSIPLLVLCAVLVGVACSVLLLRINTLNALLAGEEQAAALGIRPQREFPLLLGAATLAAAAAVSLSGIIGFVGLVIPHIIRRQAGANHRYSLLFNVMGGGLFLWLCDWVSQRWIGNGALPVGVVTALTGGPFFLWLLIANGRKARW